MIEKQKNTISEKNGEFKVDVTVDGVIGKARDRILDKSRQFLRWFASEDQTELDLACEAQVILGSVTARMDKPEGKNISLGLNADKVSKQDSAKLFAMLQKGDPVQIIIREIPKAKK